MAYFYMNASVQNRGGSSSVMRSAYISGTAIRDDYKQETYNFTNKEEVIHTEVIVPSYAPKEYQDRETLWNAVEKIENGNGRTARTFIVALPEELPIKANVQMVKEYCQDEFVKSGRCVDFAIHDKEGNLHAHIMTTVRPIDKKGNWEFKTEKVYICKNPDGEEKSLTAKELKLEQYKDYEKQLPYYKYGDVTEQKKYLTKTEYASGNYENFSRVKGKNDPKKVRQDNVNNKYEKWNSRVELTKAERNFEKYANHYLEKHGIEQRIDSRTYAERGEERIGQKHLGNKCYHLEKHGIETDRGNYNRKVIEFNRTVMGEHGTAKELNYQLKKKAEFEREKEIIQKEIEKSKVSILEKQQTLKNEFAEERDKAKLFADDYNNVKVIESKIRELEERRDNCGIFQLKQKKEFTEKIREYKEYREDTFRRTSNATGVNITSIEDIKLQVMEHKSKAEELKKEYNMNRPSSVPEVPQEHKESKKSIIERLNSLRQERENIEEKQPYSQPKEQMEEKLKSIEAKNKNASHSKDSWSQER